jgi:hypothetical protein
MKYALRSSWRIFMKRISWIGLLLSLIFVLVACNGADPDDPTATEPADGPAETAVPPIPTTEDDVDTTGTIFIESLQVFVLESFPVQVQALVSGNLSDGCTTISDVGAEQNEETFQIQIQTERDPEMMCTQALVPFERTVDLMVEGLPAGTYTVVASDLSDTFTLTADNAPPPLTPDLRNASLVADVDTAVPGQTLSLEGSGFPAEGTVQIGLGPVDSEYDIVGSAEVGVSGHLTAQVELPASVQPGQQWVVVAVVENAQVISDPILIRSADAATSVPSDGVNEPVNGLFSRTTIFLIALEDAGQSEEMIGCNDSVVPVVVEIEPTAGPLTAALNELLSLDEQYYGESGLYNALYQSDLRLEGVSIQNGAATIQLAGDLLLGGACDNPRVQAQLEETALQYHTVDSVTITVNGTPLGVLLSGQ